MNQCRIVRNEHLFMVETLVYGEHDRLKGFVSILKSSFIATLSVSVDDWNHGIGTKLVRWCQEKYSHLEADIYKESENTVYFYMRHGLVIERELTNSDTCEQELFMIWRKD